MRLYCWPILLSFSIVAAELAAQVPSGQAPPGAVVEVPNIVIDKTGDPIPTQVGFGSVFGPIHCDDSGIYFRANTGRADPLKGPVIRLSADGKNSVEFDPRKAPGVSGSFSALHYSVDAGGRVYQLVVMTTLKDEEVESEFFLLGFSKDGAYASKNSIDLSIRPYVFLALSSGDLLISGVAEGKAKEPPRSFTGLFDAYGRLKRQVGDAAERAADSKHPPPRPTLHLDSARVGPDGYLYVLRATSPARIEILGESAELIREVRLQPPFKDAQAMELHVVPGRLMVAYQGPQETDPQSKAKRRKVRVAVYDSMTGELLVTYEFRVKGMLACYGPTDITFLTVTPQSKFAILRAELPR
jgi:hypothetical protein